MSEVTGFVRGSTQYKSSSGTPIASSRSAIIEAALSSPSETESWQKINEEIAGLNAPTPGHGRPDSSTAVFNSNLSRVSLTRVMSADAGSPVSKS